MPTQRRQGLPMVGPRRRSVPGWALAVLGLGLLPGATRVSHAESPLASAPTSDVFAVDGCADHGDDSRNALFAVDGLDPLQPEVPYAEFRTVGRLGRTALGGVNRTQGDPAVITWGFVPDGTMITSGGDSQPSNLIATLNQLYGAGPGPVSSAPWFRLFEASFDRWAELSGVTYQFEPADGGLPIDGSTPPSGSRGLYADVRIGGRSIDGSTGQNTLAFNYFPDHSDMVLDTDNAAFFGNTSGDSIRLRNTVTHEAGHGLGLNHLDSSDGAFLLEPFISAAFDGPQLDDILGVQRLYGDAYEKGRGNDTPGAAIDAGVFSGPALWTIGADGASTRVVPSQHDFISIDGVSDTDYFRFRVTTPLLTDIVLSQQGASYQEGPQDGEQMLLDTTRLGDLSFSLFRDESTQLVSVAEGAPRARGVPGEEARNLLLEPGADYFVRVSGAIDNVQLYRLDLRLRPAAVPEPSASAMALACGWALRGPRRRSA